MTFLVIMLESCRPDRMGCYCHYRPTTPNVDRIGETGARFTNAFTVNTPGEYGLVDLRKGEAGKIAPHVPYTDIVLDLPIAAKKLAEKDSRHV